MPLFIEVEENSSFNLNPLKEFSINFRLIFDRICFTEIFGNRGTNCDETLRNYDIFNFGSEKKFVNHEYPFIIKENYKYHDFPEQKITKRNFKKEQYNTKLLDKKFREAVQLQTKREPQLKRQEFLINQKEKLQLQEIIVIEKPIIEELRNKHSPEEIQKWRKKEQEKVSSFIHKKSTRNFLLQPKSMSFVVVFL